MTGQKRKDRRRLKAETSEKLVVAGTSTEAIDFMQKIKI
jgi:hypothetical protein